MTVVIAEVVAEPVLDVSVTGQTVVLIAIMDVITVVEVWCSGCAGQLVTSGPQDVTVTTVVL